jgi:hypothetical protein
MNDAGGFCWRCGRELAAEDFRRGEICRGCMSETRCCLNCSLHDPRLNNGCAESQADPSPDKEKSTFCEFFRPRRSKAAASAPPPCSSAKAAFDSLFKKKGP